MARQDIILPLIILSNEQFVHDLVKWIYHEVINIKVSFSSGPPSRVSTKRSVCIKSIPYHIAVSTAVELQQHQYQKSIHSQCIWTMTDTSVIRSGIPLGEIQHAALEHDIRTVQTHKEIEQAHEKSHILDTYRAELLQKVNVHVNELQHLNESRKRTSIFKDEMLKKVHEHLAEIEKEQHKKEEVARLKEELLAKVHTHAEELEKMDAKRADLNKYKAELLAKVEEHAKEIEHAHEKEAQVRKFSEEMKVKALEHEAHYADRVKMMESLKDDITKSARNFYGGAYCVDESA